MGAYLSEPVKEKVTEEGKTETLQWAATAMQGWRVHQEDAHNVIPAFTENAGLFGVYDGHGGSEVSEYVARRFPDFLKASQAWKDGDVATALTEAFLGFDAHLLSPEATAELRQLAGQDTKEGGDGLDDVMDETAEERRLLVEEAQIPIQEIVAKYGIPGMPADFRQQLAAELAGAALAGGGGGKRKRSNPREDEAAGDIKAKERKRAKEEKPPVGMGGGGGKSPVGSPLRQRSSKSESELRVLKAEDEAAGPPTNWKELGLAAKTETTTATAELGRGTPETATAASSGEDEEEQADDETDEEDDETFQEPPSANFDEDSNESTSDSGEEEDDDDEDGDDTDELDEDEGKEGGGEEDEEEEEEEIPLPLGDSPGVDSGTTACVAVLRDSELIVANAGDSRCIICEESGAAKELSLDHKPEDPAEKARVEAAGGRITADGRVNGGLNLSRALGDHFYKRNAALSLAKQMISPLPDIQRHPIAATDRWFLIACDGIWNSMESQTVADFVNAQLGQGETPAAVVEALCDECLAPDSSGDGTGCDNMTVLLVLLQPPQLHTAAAAANGKEPTEAESNQ